MQHSQTGRNKKELFNALLEHYPRIDSAETTQLLRELTRQHPWFSVAQYALLRNERSGDQWQFALTRLPYKPYPLLLTETEIDLNFEPLSQTSQAEQDVVDTAIEYFSSLPSPEELSARENSAKTKKKQRKESDEPDELVTETLAQVYLAQGHKQKAIEIYLRLSLKYPEKSSYFADLINSITSQQE